MDPAKYSNTPIYIDLINQQLDKLPIEKEEDFDKVIEALKSILEPQEQHTISPPLVDRINRIKEFIAEPEIYEQAQFKGIIFRRISEKIKEFSQLSFKEKQDYISDQNKIKQETDQKQAQLASKKAPELGSPAHVISEEELLQEAEARFNSEAQQAEAAQIYAQAQNAEVHPDRVIQAGRALVHAGVPREILRNLSDELKALIVEYYEGVMVLMNRGMTFNEIINEPPEERLHLLQMAQGIGRDLDER
jgi:vacuolar-type H+-ATPase subunit I/STV1